EPFRQPPARLRAQALAAQWRLANLALRLPEYRKRLQPELLRRRERDEPGPALLVEAPDSVAAFARQRLRAILDTVARQLGLGVTKVSVGLVVDLRRYVSANTTATPSQDFESPGYLFADSSDRTTCWALTPAWPWTGTRAMQPPKNGSETPCPDSSKAIPDGGGGGNASSTPIAIWRTWRGRWAMTGSCGSGIRQRGSIPPSPPRSRCRSASGPSAGSAASCRGSRSGRPHRSARP